MSEEKKQTQIEDGFFRNLYLTVKRKIAGYRPEFEQHIALFGEDGSGKTTLLTCFYGYQQESKFQKEAGYRLVAEDTTQGQTLLSYYYKIMEQQVLQTRMTSREYRFNIRLNEAPKNVGRLVWHDYPGEWWKKTKTGEEQVDKEKTFLSLLSSDVALFLVDGKKLKENGDRYLKLLFANFKDEIIRLKDAPFLNEKTPLAHFPRIWTICLTKADLLPDMTAEMFRKRIIHSVFDEMQELKREIKEIIEEPEFFNLGDDYLLLSVAEYDESNKIIKDITKQKGVDLIAPIAFTVPVKRALWWAEKKTQTIATAGKVLEIIRRLTTGWLKWVPFVGYYFGLIDDMTKKNVVNLGKAKEEAIRKEDYIDAVMIAFEEKMNSLGIRNTYIAENE